jgi:hypothetical protein
MPPVSHPSVTAQAFIATRFNVVYSEAHFSQDKSGNATRTEAWLERRFELFEQVCLPSLMAQSDPDFVWLIFLSDGTPRNYQARMEACRARLPQLVPIYCRDGEYVVGRFQAEVRARLAKGTTHAITFRIDNDDAFHRDMVRNARMECSGQQDEILNFLNGIQCELDRGVAVQVSERSNPFIVRIERVLEPDRVRTVMDIMHFQAEATGLVRDIRIGPMWLQSIHGGNITNRIDAGRYLYRCDVKAEFGMIYPFRINPLRTLRSATSSALLRRPTAGLRRFAAAVRRRISG